MQIFVLSGESNTLDVNPSTLVCDLKQMIASQTGVAAESQVLSLGGHPLNDGLSLVDNGVQALSTLSLNVGLLGGITIVRTSCCIYHFICSFVC